MIIDNEEETESWYAARVKYQKEKHIKNWLETKGVEHFIPFRTIVIEYNGRKKKKETPLIPCIVFVKTTYHAALSFPIESGYSMSYLRNLDTRKVQIIPEKQMQDCMLVLNMIDNAALHIVNANLKHGDRVRVIKGPFVGIEGELVRVKGHKRVIVRLEGVFSVMTTYIPNEFLERI